jgi:two-component system nitrogen regulation sensor histidine kinase GlnL
MFRQLFDPAMDHEPGPYPGLELLATAVLLLTDDLVVGYANPAAENLFELSRRQLVGHSARSTFGDAPALFNAIDKALATGASYTEQELELGINGKPRLHLSCTVSVVDAGDATLLLEFRHIDQQLKIAREERLLEQQQANRELIRSLAHEIKNPLGIMVRPQPSKKRELDGRRSSIHAGDHRQPTGCRRWSTLRRRTAAVYAAPTSTSIRLVSPAGCEAELSTSDPVRSLARGRRSAPARMLNVVRNAAQRCGIGAPRQIRIKTRVARSVTLAKRRYQLALAVSVEDNGPGVPETIRDRIFYPLVSGREGGSGLGLTIAQTFIAQHNGTIECESVPGCTVFTILLPLEFNRPGA